MEIIRGDMEGQGVTHALCVSVGLSEWENVHRLAQTYDNFYASVGVHPDHAAIDNPTEADLVRRAQDPKVVAVGETGLDYYRQTGDSNCQRERFRTHIRAARETGLPLIIHTRAAAKDTLAIMRDEGAEQVGGVMHCFTETLELAEAAMAMNFYVSFSGIVTFKNATALKEVARRVSLDRLLLETDAPYLAPVPFRGKTNKRWWSKLVVLKDGREVSRKEIAVNDPLVYGGLRFFQANYGRSGQVAGVKLVATPRQGGGQPQSLVLSPGEPVALGDDTSVRLERFVPDFYVRDNQIYTRSEEPNNPAIHLTLASKAGESQVWIFPNYPEYSQAAEAPYDFQFQDLQMGYFTGLQVSHEPGQWAVWAGCLLMGAGLMLALYFVHMRFWVVPISDGEGRLVLWIGASPSKNREDFEERFRDLVKEIEKNLKTEAVAGAAVPAASLAGVAGR